MNSAPNVTIITDSENQMTLGQLISKLETLPQDMQMVNFRHPHSYRGDYSCLAFEVHYGTRSVSDLLYNCKDLIGRMFFGYKGGEYTMDSNTEVFIASFGNTGTKLIDVNSDGSIAVATYSI